MYNFTIKLGCDPELFLTKNGKIVGSESIIPEKGIILKGVGNGAGKVIIDGVQAEFNPPPQTCRQDLAKEISRCFRALHEASQKKGTKLDLSQTVKIDKKELSKLDEKNQKFGCSASKNTYRKNQKSKKITIDPLKDLNRSAGGHIHLGYYKKGDMAQRIFKQPDRVIPMLDLLLGNTCVLIDRDKGNIERRKQYGYAGEYREPRHGLEYRVLSNFWLQSYPLMSFVMGMARYAVKLTANNYDREFMSLVDMGDVANAINNNDFDLALKNFYKIEKLLLSTTKPETSSYLHESSNEPITEDNIQDFYYFIAKGKDYWFKENPIEHWLKLGNNNQNGWENFLKTTVHKELKEKTNKIQMDFAMKMLDNTPRT